MSLFQMSITGGILVLFIVVIRTVAIHRLPKTTFLVLWMIAALRLLLPLSIPLPFNINIGPNIFSDVIPELPFENIGLPLQGESFPSNDTGAVVPSPATEHLSTFVILWLVGVLLLVLYFSISYVRSMRKFRMSIPVNMPYIREWLAAQQIVRPIEVRSSDLIFSPLTYGILRPVILLPKKLDRNDEMALKYVLTHEYVHIRRFDAVTKILFAAVLCVHWFNPLVWVMYVLANQDMELSCDAWVVRIMGENSRSGYALALISAEEARSGISVLYNHFREHAITERIENIMKYKRPALRVIVASAVVCAVAVLCFLTTLKAAADFPKTDSLVQLEDSIVRADDAVSFTIPQDYSEAEGWQLYIAGRAVYKDGFSRSLHYFEGEEWVAGKTYTIPIGEEITELFITVNQPGSDERTIDLLG